MFYRQFILFTAIFSSSAFAAKYDDNWINRCEQVVQNSQNRLGYKNPLSHDSTRALFTWMGRYVTKNHGVFSKLMYNAYYNPDTRFFHNSAFGNVNCEKLAEQLNGKQIDLDDIRSLKVSDIINHKSFGRISQLPGFLQEYNEGLTGMNHFLIGKETSDCDTDMNGATFDLNILPFFFPKLEKLTIDFKSTGVEGLRNFAELKQIFFLDVLCKDSACKSEDCKKSQKSSSCLKQSYSSNLLNTTLTATKKLKYLNDIIIDSPQNHTVSKNILKNWLSEKSSRILAIPYMKPYENRKFTNLKNKEFLRSLGLKNAIHAYDQNLKNANENTSFLISYNRYKNDFERK